MAGRVNYEHRGGGRGALKAGYDDALGARKGTADEACEASGDGHGWTQRDGAGCRDELAHRCAKITDGMAGSGLKKRKSCGMAKVFNFSQHQKRVGKRTKGQ